MSTKSEIVDAINKGKGNVEIAKALGVSTALVRKYRSLLSRGEISTKGLGTVKVTKPKSVKKAKTKVAKPKKVKTVKISKVGGFIDHQRIISKIEAGLKLGYNIALRGKTSTAKTFLVTELAKKHKKNLNYFNASVNTTVDEVKGKYVLRYDEHGKPKPEWFDSSIVKAMRNGDWVVIEEINFLSEDLLSVFYSILDNRRDLILDEKDGEVVKAHPDFRVFATMNWSYKGTNELNDALKRRFQLWCDLNYLPKSKEKSLILKKVDGADDGEVSILVDYADNYRKSKTRNKTDLGTDTLIRCVELSSQIPFKQALEFTVIPVLAYDEEEKKVIREQFNLLLKCEEIRKNYKSGIVLKVKEYGRYYNIYVVDVKDKQVEFIKTDIKKSELLKSVKDNDFVNSNKITRSLDEFHSLVLESQKDEEDDDNE